MINDLPFRKSKTNERHFGIPSLNSQLRSDGLLKCRWEFCRNMLVNMGMSVEHEIISSHTRPVHCISLEKNDYQYLISGGLDGLVALYDLNGAEIDKKKPNRNVLKNISIACNSVRERATVPTVGPTISVAISSVSWYPLDSGLFAVSDFEGNVNIWDTNAFSIVGNFKLRSKIFNSKFNSDGSLIALALDDHSIRLCDPTCGDCTHVLSGHSSGVTCVEWSPVDEFILASASWDGKMKLWDTRKGSYGAALLSFDWQQDHTARPETYLQEPPDVRYSSDRKGNSCPDHGIRPSDISSTERQALLHSDRHRVKRFDWKNDDVAKAHESSGVTSILYSACGRFIVSSGNDRKVRLWSSNNGYLHAVNYGISCSSRLPFSMAMISDFECGGDDVLAYPDGDKGEIALVALHSSTGKPFNRLRGHFGSVTSLAYRRGHSQLISAARDGMIHVWDSSLATAEKEASTVDDMHMSIKAKERRSGSRGGVAGCNDDDWSDSSGSEGGVAKGDADGSLKLSVPRRSFVPPIVQRYLDDAAEAARLLLLDKENIRAAARARGGSSAPCDASSAVRATAGYRLPSSSLPSDLEHDNGTRMGTGTETGLGNVKYRKLIVLKRKKKEEEKEKEKSYRDRAEILFALQTASALRCHVTDSSSSSSLQAVIRESPSGSGSTHGPIASASADISASTLSAPPRHPTAGIGGTMPTLRQREKEKEKEAECARTKKAKSALSSLRDKYGGGGGGGGAGGGSKKSRR